MARTVTYLPELVENDIELSVRHLKQFFKFGHGKNAFVTKAVHDVSFDIKKGECFGLVGESGCGKTTTGRTLIRLYKATSGSVYFKGYRIVAGNRWNEKEIKWKKIKSDRKIKELKAEMQEKIKSLADEQGDPEIIANETAKIQAAYNAQITEIKDNLAALVSSEKEKIAQHNYDNKHVDKKLMSKMQMIFQDPVDSLDPRMTVQDIIQEGLHIQGQYNKFENSQKVKEALTKVGLLPEYASRYPHEFSGGQRQRIGIARALIMNPDFLICDEPISALDVSIRAQIINLLNNLKEEMGLTIMFIAHDLSVVKYFCDRIAVMYFGNIVELASSDELFAHPLHPYTRALLSAIPKPDPLSEKVRKRFVYKPQEEHDYSKEGPKLTEIIPGHFVLANSEELEKYRQEINGKDKKIVKM
ncbi:MAG: ATP-binding cassette domain-containing protein [Bacilli bacterium]|nr:ATP-binding cassette domain-containing protein [Bacilli bacterium]